MELIDLMPAAQTFRLVATLDLPDGADVPTGFSGRVRFHEGDGLTAVAWYEDGRLHNPGHQHPAFRRYRPSGAVKYEMFYEYGILTDPSETTPAVSGYYADGSLHYVERYTNGQRSDSAGGAAVSKWRQDGTLRHELHYTRGVRVR
jgi:antitoxin component YwqK of YwqJK toxin-antitoxin module